MGINSKQAYIVTRPSESTSIYGVFLSEKDAIDAINKFIDDGGDKAFIESDKYDRTYHFNRFSIIPLEINKWE